MLFTAEFYRHVRYGYVRTSVVIVLLLTVAIWLLEVTYPLDGPEKLAKPSCYEPTQVPAEHEFAVFRTPVRKTRARKLPENGQETEK